MSEISKLADAVVSAFNDYESACKEEAHARNAHTDAVNTRNRTESALKNARTALDKALSVQP